MPKINALDPQMLHNLCNLCVYIVSAIRNWLKPAHSWFTSVVDGTELGPVYPIQLKA